MLRGLSLHMLEAIGGFPYLLLGQKNIKRELFEINTEVGCGFVINNMDISIFAKKAFLNINPSQDFDKRTKPIRGGHLQRVSSMIRADQVAEYLGAKLNPRRGYKNDVCIYVKPHVKSGGDFKFEGKRSYLDIIDGWALLPILGKHLEVSIIACSKQDYLNLSNIMPNKVVLIPNIIVILKELKGQAA